MSNKVFTIILTRPYNQNKQKIIKPIQTTKLISEQLQHGQYDHYYQNPYNNYSIDGEKIIDLSSSNFLLNNNKIHLNKLSPLPPRNISASGKIFKQNNNLLQQINENNQIESKYMHHKDYGKKFNNTKDKLKGKSSKKTFKRFGIIYLVIFFLNLFLFDTVVHFVLKSQFQINPGNIFYNFIWKELPISLYGDFYLYEIRNIKQFLLGEKPDLKEYGPFVFRIHRKRKVIKWTNTTVIFKEQFFAKFDPFLSKYPLETRLTSINKTILIIISWTYYWMEKYFLKTFAPVVDNILIITLQTFGENIVEQQSVKQLLLGRKINFLHFIDSLGVILQTWRIPFSRTLLTNYGNYRINNNTLSIIDLLTGNEFGPLEHYRFEDNYFKTNEVKKILNSRLYENYKPPCNYVMGFDPLYFGINQDERLNIYIQHFCRTLTFHLNKTMFVRGVRSNNYHISSTMFKMSIPENQCYCFGKRTLTECDGYTDMSGCFGGLQFGLSHPHFLGSPRLLSKVSGLKPEWNKHLSTMNIEPNTGLLFQANFVFQINFIIRKYPALKHFNTIRPCLLPYFTISLKIKSQGFLHGLLVICSFLLYYGKFLIALVTLILSAFFFYRSQ